MFVTQPALAGRKIMNIFLNNIKRLPFFIVIPVNFMLCAAGVAQSRSASLADLGTRIALSSPAISPDGKYIAVVTSRANYADNRFERSLVLVDAATGAKRTLTSGQHSNASSPQWSPRGDRLAWLDTEERDQPPQIYILSMLEGDTRPVRVTNASNGVRTNTIGGQSYAWSPDGRAIAFITPDTKTERQGEERHNLSFEVIDNDYLATEPPATFHVWVVSATGGGPRRLTSGVESAASLGWVQNNQSVAVAVQPRPHNSPSDFAEFMHNSAVTTALKTIDIASGDQHVTVPTPVRIWSSPVSSPNGSWIAFLRFQGAEPWNRPHDVAVVASSGGEARDVTRGLDRDVNDFAWLPQSDALLVSAPDGTRLGLWSQSVDGSSRQRLDLGSVIDLRDLSVSQKGSVAFIGIESRNPPELYVMTSINAKPRRLSDFNQQIASLQLGHTETVRWQLDGFEQTGVLIYPPQFKKGQKVPLVLNIHGGPEGTSTEAFELFDQILAGRGWAVFKPNYRGSNSQGEAFQTAVAGDLGDGPGRDVMAGLATVKALGFVDEDRVAVSGWSYGGYMTAWLIGHYQGWSSAVAGAPLTNALDWYNLSCCNAWADPVLKGSPWLNNNFANYWHWSPVSYAHEVKTPTLILQNMGDPEVPYTGSYHFYHALRDNGAPVKFVVYPIQGHGYNGDPIHQRDTLRRWLTWIDEHFRAPAQGQH